MNARKLPVVYTEAQMIQLVRAPRPHATTGLRDRAILAVLACCGLRANELCHLRVCDVHASEFRIFVRQGKLGDERYVAVTQRTLAAIQAYLAQYRAADEMPLFRCLDGRPITRRHLHKLVVSYSKRLGLGGAVHSLRHSCAVRWLNRGLSLQIRP